MIPPTLPADAHHWHSMESFQYIARRRAEEEVAAIALKDSEAQTTETYKEELDHDELEEEDPIDDSAITTEDICSKSTYFPYPSETAVLLDTLDNLARCRFTGVQLALILHLLKRTGARDVPKTLKALRKIQKEVHENFEDKPIKVTSAQGNIFYMNDIQKSIARDFSNPLIAPHLHLYPEEVIGGPVTERWQAQRALDYFPNELTPMFSNGHRRWWINEVAQLRDGRFIIPQTWIVRSGHLTCDAYSVQRTADLHWDCDGRELQVNAEELEADFEDLRQRFGSDFIWTERSSPFVSSFTMPNPKRQLSGERDFYVLGLTIWIDDVSGNRSKQYNKFMVMVAQNTALPGKLLKQEFHVHFMGASQHVTTAELSAALRDTLQSTEENPIICFNAHTKREAAVTLRVSDKDADNPQQSEEASHIGCNGNCPCRKCKWGGSKKEKELEAQYHACHEPGVARTAAEIRLELTKQLEMATMGSSAAIEARQKETGTKDKLAQFWIEKVLAQVTSMKTANPSRSQKSIAAEAQQWLDQQPGDKMNPLLDITGLDPARDTPVEILHTVLLGVVKYIWHHLHTKQWSDTDRHLLAIRLQSTDTSGLSIPPIQAAYMMQYRNNLIGKHFKTLMQILTFHVYGLCTPEQQQLVKAAADLGARVWVSTIDDMELYISELKLAIANVLDAWDAVDPLRILVKIKLHLLAHLPDDVRRFGPAVRFSTETQEGYNAVFRMCSINGNKQAPSRDIAAKFAAMDGVKHLLCGGFWESATSRNNNTLTKVWLEPGHGVRNIILQDPVFQRHLGWVTTESASPGSVRLVAEDRNPSITWPHTQASKYISIKSPKPPADSLWKFGLHVTAKSGDKIKVRGWVFAKDVDDAVVFGRVSEIVSSQSTCFVTLERFNCTEKRHPDLNWPVVRRPTGEEIICGVSSFVVVTGAQLEFTCSVQHDCRRGSCRPSVTGKQRQERQETTHDIQLIKHDDDDHFILDMGAIHNFEKLTRVLPLHMYKLSPLQINRKEFHKVASLKAQSSRLAARKRTADRRAQTASAKKKLAKELAVEAADAESKATRARAIAAGLLAPDDGEESELSEFDSDVDSVADGANLNLDAEEDGDEDEDYIAKVYSNKRVRNEQGGRDGGGKTRRT
ncbi:hypothetical protein MIND_00915600 [Mycena indigotica]|uniref:Uncharacterized protein n=1 Tax=Mycena indigotica TaxID=2126181 RepID=A0A8H6SDA9_9AGAR|nr:uncharacterized protein MIND_00915600 [Mycena indigotica]KAF7296843.1 hypothetical protein MIND_00915600 [Mycena indigotica]